MPTLGAGSNVIFRMFTEHLGGTRAADFIGNFGDIFYDPASGMLMIADGSIPGGIPISGVSPSANLVVDSLYGSNDTIFIIKAKDQPGAANGAILSLMAGDSASGNSAGDVYISSGDSQGTGVAPGNVYITVGDAVNPADYADTGIYIGTAHSATVRIGNPSTNVNISSDFLTINDGPIANAIGNATSSALGVVQVDGVSIIAAANGRISAINGTNTQSTFANLQVVDTATVANLSVGGDNLYANMSTLAIVQAPYTRLGPNTNSIVLQSSNGSIAINAAGFDLTGGNVSIVGNVFINGSNNFNYTLPVANTTTLGGVIPDGVRIIANTLGGITVNTVGLAVTNATNVAVGVVKPDNASTFVDANGTLRAITGNSSISVFANITVTNTATIDTLVVANVTSFNASELLTFTAYGNTSSAGLYGPINGGLYGDNTLRIKGANYQNTGSNTGTTVEILAGTSFGAPGGGILIASAQGNVSDSITLSTPYGDIAAGSIDLIAGDSGVNGGSVNIIAGSGATTSGNINLVGGLNQNFITPVKGGTVSIQGGDKTGPALGPVGDVIIGTIHTANVTIGSSTTNLNMSGAEITATSDSTLNMSGAGAVTLSSAALTTVTGAGLTLGTTGGGRILLSTPTTYAPQGASIFTTRFTPTGLNSGVPAITYIDHTVQGDRVFFRSGVNSPSSGSNFWYISLLNTGIQVGTSKKFEVIFNQIGVTLATPLQFAVALNGQIAASTGDLFYNGVVKPVTTGQFWMVLPNNACTRFEYEVFRYGAGLNQYYWAVNSTTLTAGV
jgi:hypothetical protein